MPGRLDEGHDSGGGEYYEGSDQPATRRKVEAPAPGPRLLKARALVLGRGLRCLMFFLHPRVHPPNEKRNVH